jgi:hypothetical protein
VTKRTDVYAVGALVWHLLTGVAPDLDGELPAASLPPAVDAVLRHALARRPEDRFPSATALADELDAAAIELVRSPPAAPRPAARSAAARPDAGGRPNVDPEATEVVPPGADVTQVLRPDRPRTSRPATGAAAGRRPRDARPAAPVARPAEVSGEDTMQLRRPRRWARRVALVAVLAILVAGGAVGYVLVWRARESVDVTAAGLHVRVPAAWARQQQAGAWDLTPFGGAGEQGTALLVARDVTGWRDPASATPGVFVGAARGVAADSLWAASAVKSCRPYTQETRQLPSGLSGTVRRHECAGSPARVTEAVLTRPGSDQLVFVQVKEPLADHDAAAVLDSVTVAVS